MPRPVVPRTRRTYQRDLEALSRLRTAIMIDMTLTREAQRVVVKQIDGLTTALVELFEQSPL